VAPEIHTAGGICERDVGINFLLTLGVNDAASRRFAVSAAAGLPTSSHTEARMPLHIS